ncbi:MAG: hypothetical protein EOM50_15435 [Erysipelotrichia bacterium]|nr:hypothetical protein [Erysipelotrichia bacterium]
MSLEDIGLAAWLNLQVALIDDVFSLAHYIGLQRKLLILFKELFKAHKQIVLVSCEAPLNRRGFTRAFNQFCECGFITDMQSCKTYCIKN